ncbi:MAG: virulence RhuM family protein, partial [Bacteroidales bacterium]|nr:virulence RhuM family protein [Bacteroidales bacterium]
MTEGQIILYQPNSTVRIEVRLEDDTVWLTQAQLIELFDSSKPNISEHLKNIFTSGELDKTATVRKNRTVQIEGNRKVSRLLEYYNLDVIISVGYRVNTVRGIKFRQWATKILKEYLLRGYAINSRIDRIEKTVAIQGEKIDFLIQTALPPSEGIFFEGQIFDAYSLICDLLRTAKERVILVDNYIDDTVLRQLDKRPERVTATIYTMTISKTLQQDLERH